MLRGCLRRMQLLLVRTTCMLLDVTSLRLLKGTSCLLRSQAELHLRLLAACCLFFWSCDSCSLDAVVATCPQATSEWARHLQLLLCSPNGCESAVQGRPWHTSQWQARFVNAGTRWATKAAAFVVLQL